MKRARQTKPEEERVPTKKQQQQHQQQQQPVLPGPFSHPHAPKKKKK